MARPWIFMAVLTLVWTCAGFPAFAAVPSPAEQRIAELEALIAKDPRHAAQHAALALAFARRARETADGAWYQRAHDALDVAEKLVPDDFEVARTRVWVLLGQHEFAKALVAAKALNARFPDDLMSYALLVDAHVELGDYAAAEHAAQWLLDLRPGAIPGLTRAAYLREIFGDPEGALELMLQALTRTAPAEVEDQAWLLVQIAHLNLQLGRIETAERAARDALDRFPGYHYALAQLAQVREAQERHEDALALRRAHVAAAPHPENRLWLARAFARAGDAASARREFAAFAEAARAESANWDNANRELVEYLAEEGKDTAGAVALAEREFARRQDIHTRAALSWALHRHGRHAEAWQHTVEVMKVGTQDPTLLFRAGLAARAAGHGDAALPWLAQALSRAPWHPLAAAARAGLGGMHANADTLEP